MLDRKTSIDQIYYDHETMRWRSSAQDYEIDLLKSNKQKTLDHLIAEYYIKNN